MIPGSPVVEPLPIEPLLPQILSTLRATPLLLLVAPPGSGKTTRVPVALLQDGPAQGGIWVAEPRRLAVRLVARHVAELEKIPLGQAIGYAVRFESVTGPNTRLTYATTGVLLRRLLTDPLLSDVSTVVLDEFHERHLESDLLLALLYQLQKTRRPELRLVVMSATLDAERLSNLLDGCPILYCDKAPHHLEIEHAPQPDARPLPQQVGSAFWRLQELGHRGSVLVFLPGAFEIRRTQQHLLPLAERHGYELCTLHGELPLAEQARAVATGNRPKIVLSTNVAESSLTVPGVTAVIDSGLARMLAESSLSTVPRLTIQKVSRASARQRAGRAARTSEGRVLRLYTRADFESRPEYSIPEILRLDLTEPLLFILSLGTTEPSALPFLDPPLPSAWQAARDLLGRLGAINNSGELTPLGRRLTKLPLHPRLGRLLVALQDSGLGDTGCLAAALLSERDLWRGQRERDGTVAAGPSDLLFRMELFELARTLRFSSAALEREGIDVAATRAVGEMVKRLGGGSGFRTADGEVEPELARALLLAFPDRVARRRAAGGAELLLDGGKMARLASQSVVHEGTWLLALELEDHREPGRSGGTWVKLACRIEPEWLLDAFPDHLQAEESLEFVEPPGRVEQKSRLCYGSLTILESRVPAPPGPATADFLLGILKQRGLLDGEALSSLARRLELLRDSGLCPQAPLLDQAFLSQALRGLVETRNEFDGLTDTALAGHIVSQLPASVVQLLHQHVPERITLPSGRSAKLEYPPGQPPFLASRLQDFFGCAAAPRLCQGRVQLVIHLLAPNQRAVQVTTDLEGFWARHYPSIRKELMRRYPRHAWPEDGAHAQPVAHPIRRKR